MDNKSIEIPSYGKLAYANDTINLIFNRTSIFYGPSDTGKTTLMKFYMYLLRLIIPSVIVICPTDDLNESWKGFVPDRCILTNPTETRLKVILERQENSLRIYNKANNIDILKKLVSRINDHTSNLLIQKVERLASIAMKHIKESHTLNYAEKEENLSSVTDKEKKRVTNICKLTIKKYIKVLAAQMHNLSDDEKYALKYLNFNPSLLIILDDCGSEVNKWGKNEAINKLFFAGRHYWITSFYALQDDKALLPKIRKNTFMNVFTDPNCAISFFNNTANTFTKDAKKKANILAEYIFKVNDNGSPNYKKLIYNRRDPRNKFRYIIPRIRGIFKMGSSHLWMLCDSIPVSTTNNNISRNSKFFTSFSI